MLTPLLIALREQHGEALAGRRNDARVLDHVSAIQLSHRWQGRAVFLLFRAGRRRPWLVVKVDRDRRHQRRLFQELRTLRALADRPSFHGLVPWGVGMLQLPGALGMVQTGLPGGPLTAVLRRRGRFRSRSAVRDHHRVREWFARFRDEPANGPTEPRHVDLSVLGDELRRVIPGGAAGLPWVERVGRDALTAGMVRVPRVLGHGDVAPSNLLQHGRTLRLVDWEGDTAPRSPLPDVLTFLNHYARATPLDDGRLPPRDVAIERALLGRDGLSRLSWRTWCDVLDDHGVPTEVAAPLMVWTLVELASGRGGTSHQSRGQRMWAELLHHVARAASSRPETWPP